MKTSGSTCNILYREEDDIFNLKIQILVVGE